MSSDRHRSLLPLAVRRASWDALWDRLLSPPRQEPGTPAYCTELTALELKQALADAERGKAPAVRDYLMDKLLNSNPFPSHEEIISLNRSVSAGILSERNHE